MGQNLVLNMESNGFTVAVYNRTAERRASSWPATPGKSIVGCTRCKSSWPRWKSRARSCSWSRPAQPVDDVIEQLDAAAGAGRPDHRRRQLVLRGHRAPRRRSGRQEGLLYIGTGVSGGEEGALQGPGDHARRPAGGVAAGRADLPRPSPPVAEGEPCVTYIGPRGAGHYVKMVHNGIEYGDMQLIAEAYDMLHRALGLSAPGAARDLCRSGTRAS